MARGDIRDVCEDRDTSGRDRDGRCRATPNRSRPAVWGILLLAGLCALHAEAASVYFIGNSVTDQVKYTAFAQLVTSRGHPHAWGRDMIPGAPLEWIWNHPADGFQQSPYGLYPNALTNYTWDVITLQPFDRHLASDLDYAGRFMALALPRSPLCQYYVYARWPRQGGGTFDYLWLRRYTGGWDGTNETKDYFETLTRQLRAAHTNIPPVRMIPVGHTMYELSQKMQANQVPGYTNIFQVYSDGIHLNDVGQYIVGCVFFATLYRENPTGLSGAPYSVTNAALADVIQRTAWDVVRMHELSGVVVTSGLEVATSFLPSGIQGLTYSNALQAAGGVAPYRWGKTSGTVPPGVALGPDGRLAGTPSGTGTFAFVAEVCDSRWDRAARALNVSVAADTAPAVTTGGLPDGARGSRYDVALQASGGNGNLAWTLAAGSLPIGLALQPDGRLAGTPGLAGNWNFTVRVTDADPVAPDSDTRAFSLVVGPPQPGTLLIPKVAAGLVLDGRLTESFWSLTNRLAKLVAGDACNNDAAFDAVWDETNLYVAVRVLDAAPRSDSPDPWNDDSVEVFIDGFNNREREYNFDDRRIVLGIDGRRAGTGDASGIRGVVALVAGGYTMEVAVPWTNVAVAATANVTVGLDVAGNDDDDGATRDSQVVWWGTADNATDPSAFGSAVLTDRVVVDEAPARRTGTVLTVRDR